MKFWDSEPAKLYGVRAIPSNFLVNKEGIIVAKDIKGDQLEETLKDIFKNKLFREINYFKQILTCRWNLFFICTHL